MPDDKDEKSQESRPIDWRVRSPRACGLLSVFTPAEKQLLVGQSYRDCDMNHVDFSGADLRGTSFVNMSLQGCDFSQANLRGVSFIACDLRRTNFEKALFSCNSFDKSCLIATTGISKLIQSYITTRGGCFWYC